MSKKVTQYEVLQMIRDGRYQVNTKTGEVKNKKGKTLTPLPTGKLDEYLRVRLYTECGRQLSVGVHRLVWMAATRHTIPSDFEVHHRDQDTLNNDFENLLCVHKYDHRKLHEDEEVPF